MNYSESVTRAIAYIEKHLLEGLTLDEVAAIVGYSPYHFHRIFQSVTHSSVMDYVRRRRLTHAARDLLHTDRRIIEIAIAYRFESQEAFTRAFRRMFTVSPGQFRKQQAKHNAPLRMLERPALNEAGLRHLYNGVTHEPRIVSMERMRLIGMKLRGFDPGEIGALWSRFKARSAEIQARCDPSPVYYAVIAPEGEQWEMTYTACVEVSGEGVQPEGMVITVLLARTYAVFSHRGQLDRLQDTYQYIYSSWLPRSGRVRLEAPEFARYDHRYRGPSNEESEFKIYIPVSPTDN